MLLLALALPPLLAEAVLLAAFGEVPRANAFFRESLNARSVTRGACLPDVYRGMMDHLV